MHEAVKRLRQSSQPLVIDLGCGFGASSLGLAECGNAVLAVDASAHCIRYATALSRRWQLPQSQVSFVQCAAEDALAAVRRVEIDVKWILINFPTPFAAPENDGAWLSCLKRYEVVVLSCAHLITFEVTSPAFTLSPLHVELCKHLIPLDYMIYHIALQCLMLRNLGKHHIIHPAGPDPRCQRRDGHQWQQCLSNTAMTRKCKTQTCSA